jgi:signal transduction histidine kinase/ligand-binding sensor domain-containing protein
MNLDSGTESATGGWLRRLEFVLNIFTIKVICTGVFDHLVELLVTLSQHGFNSYRHFELGASESCSLLRLGKRFRIIFMTLALIRMPRWRWMASFIVIWTLAADGAVDAGWIVRTWQTDDGLPGNTVTGLSQTKDGYLWVATHNGLARFDGVHFENFPLTNFANILSEDIASLMSVSSGGLLLAVNHGALAYLNFGSAKVTINPFTNRPTVTAMVEDKDGGLFVAFGLEVVRIINGQEKKFTAQDGMPDGTCSSLIKDTNGLVWLAKGTNVAVLRGDHFKTMLSFNTRRPLQLATAKSGGIWVCSNDQIFTCDDKGGLKRVGTFGDKSSLPRPTVLLEDRDGYVWIGTRRNGLYRFDGSACQSIPTSDSWIICLAEDRQGNIWAGTGGAGLDQVRPKLIQLEGSNTGLAAEAIQSVCEDLQNRLWALSRSGLLLLRTNGGWSLASSHTNLINVTANALAADREGSLWMETTGHKLVRWQNGVFEVWGLKNGILGSLIREILASSNGDIWIGEGRPEILQIIHSNTLKTVSLPSDFHYIRVMAEGIGGNFFIAGANGKLIRVWNDHGQYETEQIRELPQRKILCLSTSSDGSLWIGYEDAGVGRLKNGHFALIGHEQELYDDNISEIIDDGRGSLWFGSNHGIFRAQKSVLDAVAEGRLSRVESIHYGSDQGLPDNLRATGNAVLSHDGRIWMPMGTFLAIISPEKVFHDSTPPVLLTKIEVDGRTVASYGGDIMPVQDVVPLRKPGAPLSLQAGYHRLDFNFTALDFVAPNNVNFHYRLDGLDTEWSKATPQRSVTYSRLSPGNYRFRVMACNSSGVWNEADASLHFSVLPFVWQKWWFRLAVVAFFTAAVLSVGRYFSHRNLQRRLLKLEQQAALNKERARIARDLHDDLGGCLTQIVMVSGLNRRGRIPAERAYNEVQSATRYAIQALDQTVWAINPRNDTLPSFINYTSQFAVDFLRTAGIKCDTDIPEQLPAWTVPAEARHNLFLIVKEAVNNIVRHASASEVKFQVVISDKTLRLTIQDNGHGFASASASASADLGADGLRNMRQRMDNLGGEFQIESAPGAGTCIKLVFRPSPRM